MSERFSTRVRVGFDETDAQGVVYYGRYNPYFDRGRVEYLRAIGHLADAPGREYVMRANAVEYHAPARFDDELIVYAHVERIGTSSIAWRFDAHLAADGTQLCSAEQTLVLIDVATRRPVAIGEAMRAAVATAEGWDPPAATAPTAATTAGRGSGAVEAVERIINREGEADAILRAAVAEIAKRYAAPCGIRFVEDGDLVLGPAAGGDPSSGTAVAVPYEGSTVAELVVAAELDDTDRAALTRCATLLSPYCLVGWDTGGEEWHA